MRAFSLTCTGFAAALLLCLCPLPASAASSSADAARFVAAYPSAITHADGNWLVWRDGTRMAFDDSKGTKPFKEWLETPDIEDTLRLPYPADTGASEPTLEYDPGRARNATFFDKMYGDCRKGEVKAKLKSIIWLPTKAPQRLEVTTVNGVADRLAAISQELDRLPAEFDAFLTPAAGTYNCRTIAGTNRVSAHGYGIAIDIAVRRSDYWRWAPKASGKIRYRNRIPLEIVRIFERHGFIWGGRWYHYDTMHFEYRPELLPAFAPTGGQSQPVTAPN